MILKEVLTNVDLVSVSVTIIGLIITSKNLKKTFENEIIKVKREKTLDKLIEVLYSLIEFFDAMVNDNSNSLDKNKRNKKKNIENKSLVEDMNVIFGKIYAYGSQDAIKLVTYFKTSSDIPAKAGNNLRPLGAYSLLITQIKYDVTGDIISADFFYKMKINDYKKIGSELGQTINEIIIELDLNREFMINNKK